MAAMRALYGHYSQAERNVVVKIVIDRFDKDVPVIVRNQRVDFYAVNSDLRGFNPNSITPFDNFMNVDT
jgi:hypothetical protein